MTAGLSSANLVTRWLNMLRATAFTAPAATWVELHIGDPGAAGTANPSAVTTRSQATLNASSGGSALSLSNTPTWSMTATETISHIAVFDASSGGNFLFSIALSVSRAVNNGDTLNQASLSLGLAPQAA